MFCNHCGRTIQEDGNFCSYCGHQVGRNPVRPPLIRPRVGRKLGGVCLGFAQHLDMDVTLVRVLVVVITIFTFPVGLIAYLVAWIVMPDAPIPHEVPQGAHSIHT